jgi:magnesium-protoporphyrin O-methyltransferase
VSQKALDDYRNRGLGEAATVIADELGKRGLAGSTVLELGCGIGDLTLELLRRGAISATGLDLSPKMVQIATALAREAGLSGSASFRLGDGATANLEKSDLVVLNAVICCYPDFASLLDNSSAAAGKYYLFSVPDDGRFTTRLLRVLLPLQRLVFRRDNFRFFIHPTNEIRRRLEAKGFRLVSKPAVGWIWSVFLFAAPGSS